MPVGLLGIPSYRSLIYRLVKHLAMAAPFMMKHHLARERRQDAEDEGEAVLCRWQLDAVKRHAPLSIWGSLLSPFLLQSLITSGQA